MAEQSFSEAVELGEASGYAELWSSLLPIGLDRGRPGLPGLVHGPVR